MSILLELCDKWVHCTRYNEIVIINKQDLSSSCHNVIISEKFRQINFPSPKRTF